MATLLLNADRVTSFFAQWNALIGNSIEDHQNKNSDVIVVYSGEHRAEPNKNERGVALLASILPNKGVYVPGVFAAFKRGATPQEGQLLVVHGPGTAISVPVAVEGAEPTAQAHFKVVAAGDAGVAQNADVKEFLQGASVVGTTLKELALQTGAFADSAKQLVDSINAVEASAVIGMSLRQKDKAAQSSVQKAGVLLGRVLKSHILPELDTLPATPRDAKEGKSLTKKQFTVDMSWLCNNALKVEGLSGLKDSDSFKSSLMFVGQSGGSYSTSLKVSGGGDEPLTGDCVVVSGGASYEGYTAFVARTYVFPDRCGEDIIEQYQFASMLHDKLVEFARPGASYTDAAKQVINYAKSINPTLAERLDTTDFGCNTGLTILAGKEYINEANVTSVFQPGSTVVLRIALTNLPAGPTHIKEEPKEDDDVKKEENGNGEVKKELCVSTNAIHIADTFLLGDESNLSYTKSKKDLDDIVLRIEELDEEEEHEVEYMVPVTRQQTGSVAHISNASKRDEVAKEVLAERHAAWQATGGKSNAGGEAEDITGTELGKLVNGDFGTFSGEDKPALTVDAKNKTVYLPIAGNIIAFHVSTIQKVEVKSLGSVSTLTVSFFAALETNVAFRQNRTKVFLKEAVVNSGNVESLKVCATRLTELIAAIKTADAQRKQSFGVAKGGQLQVNRRGNLPKLTKVKCRPPPAAGKHGCIGDLEAHDNGFRFTYMGGEPLTIFYDNIKHCIFQPANNDPATVFHLTLKQPIMLAKKKCDELQFGADVVDQSEALRVNRKSHDEEVAADEAEHARVIRTNQEFAMFCKKLDGPEKKVAGFPLHIQIPMKNFNFTGNTGRAMVKFRGNKDVLFALNEWPFWTQNFSEVEVISLERVFPGMQNFDMKCVHKGYRKVTELTNIPASHIEEIKNLLSHARALNFESASPLNWNQLLKVIRDDNEWEPYGPHGWVTYMRDEEDDEDEDGESDNSSGSGSSDDESDDDSDSEDSSWADEVSSSESYSAEEDSDSESWDAAERKAEEADRRRGRGDDSDDSDAPRRKKPRADQHPRAGAQRGSGGAAPRAAPQMKGVMKTAPKMPMGVKRPGMPQPGARPGGMPPPRR